MPIPDLVEMIHKINPYKDFDYKRYPLSIEGWYSEDPLFVKIIDEIKPELIIEVGTWKGASAIYMASYLRESGINAKILCIDTWLGSVDFWTDQADREKYLSLGLANGYPTVYYQFLANVLHKNLQDYIIPFPQSSLEAWRWLKIKEIKADLCYLDASHNRDDVYRDLYNYWDILNDGGVLCGDDYDRYWPTVKSAVDSFVEENRLNLEVSDNKWIVRKKANSVHFIRDKDLQKEIRDLNKALQEVQHEYLQCQKLSCRLQEEHNRLQEDYNRLQNTKAVLLARKMQGHPFLTKIADIIYRILGRL